MSTNQTDISAKTELTSANQKDTSGIPEPRSNNQKEISFTDEPKQESIIFANQLLQDAYFVREFIAERGLYSKEILNANKSLMISIEKMEREIAAGNLTADSENQVLSSMGDVLQHLKCTRIEDLRHAGERSFKLGLTLGRALAFAMMMLCISIALPLTLAFNQLTAVNQEIEAALADEKVTLFVENEIERMNAERQLNNVEPVYAKEPTASDITDSQQAIRNPGEI